MLRHIVLLLCLSFAGQLFAQQTYVIKGRVADEDTDEGLPFCNVYFKGTTIGVSADLDGYFEIRTETPTDTLVASAVGYETREKLIKQVEEQTINFRLSSSSFQLAEVVVLAGENPANEVVRNIIKNKPINRLSGLDAYYYESYQKTELDLENINEDLRNTNSSNPSTLSLIILTVPRMNAPFSLPILRKASKIFTT